MSVIICGDWSIESEGNVIVNDESLSLSDGLITAESGLGGPAPPQQFYFQ